MAPHPIGKMFQRMNLHLRTDGPQLGFGIDTIKVSFFGLPFTYFPKTHVYIL